MIVFYSFTIILIPNSTMIINKAIDYNSNLYLLLTHQIFTPGLLRSQTFKTHSRYPFLRILFHSFHYRVSLQPMHYFSTFLKLNLTFIHIYTTLSIDYPLRYLRILNVDIVVLLPSYVKIMAFTRRSWLLYNRMLTFFGKWYRLRPNFIVFSL